MNKYNNGFPLDIGNLSQQSKLESIKEFAENSEELEECLVTANINGLNTRACCKGYHEIENISLFILNYLDKKADLLALSRCINAPYVDFENDANIYSYLSTDLINNPNVVLEKNQYGMCIRFYGENCYKLIKLLTRDIKSGVKNNQDEIQRKLVEYPTPEFYYNSYLYGLVKNGFTEKDIEILNGCLVLNACIRSKITTCEDVENLCLKTGISEQIQKAIEQRLEEKGIVFDSKDTKSIMRK